MKVTPVLPLLLVSLGLCGVSVAQWRREAVFRQRLAEAAGQVQVESAARLEAARKAGAFEKEIARLTQLRGDVEAKLIETSEVAGARSREVEVHNAAITEANSRLQQVTAERDRAVEELNQRTRAYNELMTQYNKLAK
jgi:hypothetical protein